MPRMLSTGLTLAFSLISVCQIASAAGADWPCWRGANRDSRSPDSGLLKEWPEGGPKLLWKNDEIGQGFVSAVVSGDTVYTAGDSDGKLLVFALGMNGKIKWKAEAGKAWTANYPGTRSTPAVDKGRVYVLSASGTLSCLDAKSGAKKWAKEMDSFGGKAGGWGYSESVLIKGNLAIVTPGGDNCIVALDAATGSPIWKSTGFSGAAHYGSCITVKMDKTEMIVGGTGGGIVGVDAKTGKTLWSNPFSANNTANCPTPAYSNGYLFWANGYGKGGICLKLQNKSGKVSASEAWTTSSMDCHHGGFIIDNGFVYGNNGGGWACLELESGKVRWNEKGIGKGSLCYADGMLYLFSENGGKAALAECSPDGLKIKGSFSVEGKGNSWAHPVVIGGCLYLRYDKTLYCFDVKKP